MYLNDMLAKAIAARHEVRPVAEASDHSEHTAAPHLVADLQRRLVAETARRERAERRLQTVTEERDEGRKEGQALRRLERELREEIESAELALAQLLPEPEHEALTDLAGMTLLYVGGRAHQIAHLRRLAERWNATLLHHDGGIDDRSGLIEAQAARADRTLFPVDCVSHSAIAIVKRVCRSTGKPCLALRNSSLTAFAAALRSLGACPSSR
jgi:uncharacterized protein DUF2325